MLAYGRGRLAVSKKRNWSFDMNSVLNPLLSAYTHAKNVPVEFWRRYQTNFIREQNHTKFFWWFLQANVKCSMRIFWLGKKKVSFVLASALLNLGDKNFPNNEAFVLSRCPFSRAVFDCTCSVAYRWRFFLIFTLRLDHDKCEFSNWFHSPRINSCHSNFISYVSMFFS